MQIFSSLIFFTTSPKDNHIRELEREIEILGQDKVTITKLASENAQLRDQNKEFEDREEELMAENQEYEAAIEEMAAVNTQFETQLQELQMAKASLENSSKNTSETAQQQLLAVAEQVAALASGNESAPAANTNPLIDAQLARARSYVQELRKEMTLLKSVRG